MMMMVKCSYLKLYKNVFRNTQKELTHAVVDNEINTNGFLPTSRSTHDFDETSP